MNFNYNSKSIIILLNFIFYINFYMLKVVLTLSISVGIPLIKEHIS